MSANTKDRCLGETLNDAVESIGAILVPPVTKWFRLFQVDLRFVVEVTFAFLRWCVPFGEFCKGYDNG